MNTAGMRLRAVHGECSTCLCEYRYNISEVIHAKRRNFPN